MACALGSIGTASGQVVLYSLEETAFKPVALLSLIGFVGALCIIPLKETLNKPLSVEI